MTTDTGTQHFLKFDSELARTFSDLLSIRADIEQSANCFREYMVETESWKKAAFFRSGHVHYARCFASGVRKRLKRDQIETLDEGNGFLAFHEFIINRRDKFVAHSVNADEQGFNAILVDPNDDPLKPLAHHHFALRYLFPREQGTDGDRQYCDFVEAVRQRLVDPMIESAKDALTNEIQSLSDDQIRSLEQMAFEVPGAENLIVNRNKFPKA